MESGSDTPGDLFRASAVGAAGAAGAMTAPYWYSYSGPAGFGEPGFDIPASDFTIEQALWTLVPGLAVLIALPGVLVIALAVVETRTGANALVTRRIAYACMVSLAVAAAVIIALLSDHPAFEFPFKKADQLGSVEVRFPPWVALGCLAFTFAWVWRVLHPGGSYRAQMTNLLEGLRIESTGPKAPRRKRCPDCAETVQFEARVCKHCGFRFSED